MYNSNFKQQLWHYNYSVDVHCDKHVRVLIKNMLIWLANPDFNCYCQFAISLSIQVFYIWEVRINSVIEQIVVTEVKHVKTMYMQPSTSAGATTRAYLFAVNFDLHCAKNQTFNQTDFSLSNCRKKEEKIRKREGVDDLANAPQRQISSLQRFEVMPNIKNWPEFWVNLSVVGNNCDCWVLAQMSEAVVLGFFGFRSRCRLVARQPS